jgi:dTDP-4-dehydrorhamnose 3,5-epimerase
VTMTIIPGLTIAPLSRIHHELGDVLHIMRSSSNESLDIMEIYASSVLCNKRKGWKRHLRLTLNLVVIEGAIDFSFVDDRVNKHNPTALTFHADPLDNHSRITVPPLVWVAFEGLKASNILVNCIAEPHDPLEQENIPLDSFPF